MNEKEKIKEFINRGFSYDQITGNMFGISGKIIIDISKKGYIRCRIRLGDKSLMVFAHRLAWYIINNEIPNQIDHINGIKTDNRITNLRNVNGNINQQNKIGKKGYTLTKSGKFRAQITLNGTNIHLGTYNTKEEANQAYLNAKKIYHKECLIS